MKIAVCDDENKIVEEITSYIKKDFPMSEVRAYSNGESFLAASEERPEVLLLDIDMPGISGMEVAAALTREKVSTLIVFVTAHDELVYDSFKYHPFAFVRKKFLEEELKTVLSDCEKQLVSRNKNFVFQNASKLVTLSQNDILYFEGQANYLAIHTTSDEYKMRSTMAGVEKELEDSDFLRIHKGFLVNLEHIRVLKTEELELDNGTVLPIGKSYSEAAKKSILKYMRR